MKQFPNFGGFCFLCISVGPIWSSHKDNAKIQNIWKNMGTSSSNCTSTSWHWFLGVPAFYKTTLEFLTNLFKCSFSPICGSLYTPVVILKNDNGSFFKDPFKEQFSFHYSYRKKKKSWLWEMQGYHHTCDGFSHFLRNSSLAFTRNSFTVRKQRGRNNDEKEERCLKILTVE